MKRETSIIDRVNYAMSIVEDPCNGPPWIVQLELALPPAGDAILTMMMFGWDDVARGFFRPRGLHRGKGARRGPRATGRLHRLGRALGRLPGLGDDPGDFIGKRLPGAKTVKGRKIGLGEKIVWLVDNRLQVALFWWLVIDVVEGFFYDWTTLIMASEVCTRAFGAAGYATGDGGGASRFSRWVGTFVDDVRWEESGIQMQTSKINVPPGTWKITAAGIFRNVGSGGGFHGLRLHTGPNNDPNVLDENLSGVVPVGVAVENVVMATVRGPVGVWVMQRSFFSTFVGEELHDICTGNPLGFVPPPLPPCERL